MAALPDAMFDADNHHDDRHSLMDAISFSERPIVDTLAAGGVRRRARHWRPTWCASRCARISRAWFDPGHEMMQDSRIPVLVGVGAIASARPIRVAKEPLALMVAGARTRGRGRRQWRAARARRSIRRRAASGITPIRVGCSRNASAHRARGPRSPRSACSRRRCSGARRPHRGRARRRGARRRRRSAASRAAREKRSASKRRHAKLPPRRRHGAAPARADPLGRRDRAASDAGHPVRDDRERAARRGRRLASKRTAREVAGAVGGFAAVARAIPDAWSREAPTPPRCRFRRNPFLAFPYGKLHARSGTSIRPRG